MTDESDGPMWPPTMFDLFQETGEQAMESQQELVKQMLGAGFSGDGVDMSQLSTLTGTATFKTRVQSGGRISIPDAEREALDIGEGDIVQTVVIPVKRDRSD
ncbi:MAG: AbrB/MazE/SpoVT family DNA-binding domain-containing protein [Salinirussus sp.]